MKVPKYLFFVAIGISILLCSCGNKEALERYEREKQAFEKMRQEHKLEVESALMRGASDVEILILEIENADEEKAQADKLYQLAKEAGLEK